MKEDAKEISYSPAIPNPNPDAMERISNKTNHLLPSLSSSLALTERYKPRGIARKSSKIAVKIIIFFHFQKFLSALSSQNRYQKTHKNLCL